MDVNARPLFHFLSITADIYRKEIYLLSQSSCDKGTRRLAQLSRLALCASPKAGVDYETGEKGRKGCRQVSE